MRPRFVPIALLLKTTILYAKCEFSHNWIQRNYISPSILEQSNPLLHTEFYAMQHECIWNSGFKARIPIFVFPTK